MITRAVRWFFGIISLEKLLNASHYIGFKGQTEVLAQLFNLVTENQIRVPLFDPSQVSDPNADNIKFLSDYVSALLQNAFPHLQR